MGTKRRPFSGCRSGLFGLALLALAFRVLCPPGFMIAETAGAAHVVICTGHGPLDLTHPSDPAHEGKSSHDAPCAFSGGSASAPPVAGVVLAALPYAYQAPRVDRAGDLVPGRGLAAPPPPSQGPPRSV